MTRGYDPKKRHEYYIKNKERDNLRNREWIKNNKEKHKLLCKNWRENNYEKHLDLTRKWYKENREYKLACDAKWARENAHLKRLYRSRRRALESGAPGFATYQQTQWRLEFHGWRCFYCKGPFEEIDHAIPLSRGGSNWPSNLLPSCRSCNRRKFMQTYKEFGIQALFI